MTEAASTKSAIEEKIDAMSGQNSIRKQIEEIKPILEFNKTPKQIKAELDRSIISQETGKKVIATAIAFHYKRVSETLREYMEQEAVKLDEALKRIKPTKANILIIGDSGCGKTYTAEKASNIVNVPFIKEDMTKFSETGYVGRDLSEIIFDSMSAAGGNPLLAQLGIIYLDEIDKIVGAPVHGRDVSGMGVQNGLLKLVENAENQINIHGKPYTYSTKLNLFIASGAFEDLEKVVVNRLVRQNISYNDWREYAVSEDFIAMGLSRQLIGRFPVKVYYYPLKKDDLVRIMKESDDSPLHAYRRDLANWGLELTFDDEALGIVADIAEQEKTGARGIIGILNNILLEDMYALPGERTGRLHINKDYIYSKLSLVPAEPAE